MGQANNGGLNSYLTYSYEIAAIDVVAALTAVGATESARQLKHVLDALGEPLPASTQDERWAVMEKCWTEDLYVVDVLSDEADAELMEVLERHVAQDMDFYRRLS